MKETILYSYHIKVENLKEYDEYSVFQMGEATYYFTKLKRTEKEFQELLYVMEELFKKNISVFPFIKNSSGQFITMVGTIPYVLVMVTNPTQEYGILDIMDYQKKFVLHYTKSNLYRNEWANLWSSKVDYLEYQVHELGKNYPIILDSFSYYVGLAENAICYVRFIEKRVGVPKGLPIVLSHRRVSYPNYRLNFDNPLHFIFDLEVRDIASYIKSMFFKDSDAAMIDLKAFIDLRKPDVYSLCMLYARLLYPSYYFDLHEKIIEHEAQEDCLLSIIDVVDQYEEFLRKSWLLFREYAPIEPIPWLLKKES